MSQTLESLWDDENFVVQSGVIPGEAQRIARLSGADLGAGVIYSPANIDLTDNLGLTEFSSPFIRVALKPSAQLKSELPDDFFGLVTAALLQDEWAKPFKDSVRDDLDAIREFIEPLRFRHTPGPETIERAALAKQDLDLKLLWSTREYARLNVFTLGYSTRTLAAATPSTGLIGVSVNTLDTSTPRKPVPGCEVWYVARIKSGKKAWYKSYSSYSTPTHPESLAVGNYEMWAEKGGNSGPIRRVTVVSVSTTQSVDITAP